MHWSRLLGLLSAQIEDLEFIFQNSQLGVVLFFLRPFNTHTCKPIVQGKCPLHEPSFRLAQLLRIGAEHELTTSPFWRFLSSWLSFLPIIVDTILSKLCPVGIVFKKMSNMTNFIGGVIIFVQNVLLTTQKAKHFGEEIMNHNTWKFYNLILH